MLTTGQLITIFSKTKKKETPPNMSEMVDIIKYVTPDMCLNEDCISYTCKIKISDLSSSGISDEMIYDMAEKGWIISKDRKYIENFYQ